MKETGVVKIPPGFKKYFIIKMAGKEGMQQVDLTKLNLMQLTQFKNQLDQDLTFYQESIQNLKLAQSK